MKDRLRQIWCALRHAGHRFDLVGVAFHGVTIRCSRCGCTREV